MEKKIVILTLLLSGFFFSDFKAAVEITAAKTEKNATATLTSPILGPALTREKAASDSNPASPSSTPSISEQSWFQGLLGGLGGLLLLGAAGGLAIGMHYRDQKKTLEKANELFKKTDKTPEENKELLRLFNKLGKRRQADLMLSDGAENRLERLAHLLKNINGDIKSQDRIIELTRELSTHPAVIAAKKKAEQEAGQADGKKPIVLGGAAGAAASAGAERPPQIESTAEPGSTSTDRAQRQFPASTMPAPGSLRRTQSAGALLSLVQASPVEQKPTAKTAEAQRSGEVSQSPQVAQPPASSTEGPVVFNDQEKALIEQIKADPTQLAKMIEDGNEVQLFKLQNAEGPQFAALKAAFQQVGITSPDQIKGDQSPMLKGLLKDAFGNKVGMAGAGPESATVPARVRDRDKSPGVVPPLRLPVPPQASTPADSQRLQRSGLLPGLGGLPARLPVRLKRPEELSEGPGSPRAAAQEAVKSDLSTPADVPLPESPPPSPRSQNPVGAESGSPTTDMGQRQLPDSTTPAPGSLGRTQSAGALLPTSGLRASGVGAAESPLPALPPSPRPGDSGQPTSPRQGDNPLALAGSLDAAVALPLPQSPPASPRPVKTDPGAVSPAIQPSPERALPSVPRIPLLPSSKPLPQGQLLEETLQEEQKTSSRHKPDPAQNSEQLEQQTLPSVPRITEKGALPPAARSAVPLMIIDRPVAAPIEERGALPPVIKPAPMSITVSVPPPNREAEEPKQEAEATQTPTAPTASTAPKSANARSPLPLRPTELAEIEIQTDKASAARAATADAGTQTDVPRLGQNGDPIHTAAQASHLADERPAPQDPRPGQDPFAQSSQAILPPPPPLSPRLLPAAPSSPAAGAPALRRPSPPNSPRTDAGTQTADPASGDLTPEQRAASEASAEAARAAAATSGTAEMAAPALGTPALRQAPPPTSSSASLLPGLSAGERPVASAGTTPASDTPKGVNAARQMAEDASGQKSETPAPADVGPERPVEGLVSDSQDRAFPVFEQRRIAGLPAAESARVAVESPNLPPTTEDAVRRLFAQNPARQGSEDQFFEELDSLEPQKSKAERKEAVRLMIEANTIKNEAEKKVSALEEEVRKLRESGDAMGDFAARQAIQLFEARANAQIAIERAAKLKKKVKKAIKKSKKEIEKAKSAVRKQTALADKAVDGAAEVVAAAKAEKEEFLSDASRRLQGAALLPIGNPAEVGARGLGTAGPTQVTVRPLDSDAAIAMRGSGTTGSDGAGGSSGGKRVRFTADGPAAGAGPRQRPSSAAPAAGGPFTKPATSKEENDRRLRRAAADAAQSKVRPGSAGAGVGPGNRTVFAAIREGTRSARGAAAQGGGGGSNPKAR